MVYCRERESESPPLSLILPYLYLGAEADVTQDCLTSQGISYVLSVSRCCPQPAFLPQKQYLRIPIDDSLRDELLPWIPEALQFIDGAMSCGCSVLVHCAAGVSRSPALAVAYVMYRLGLGLDDAYRFVKERRPSISPNFNFLGQLQSFQGTLLHKNCGANQNAKLIVPPGESALSTNGNTGHSLTVPLPVNQDAYIKNLIEGDFFSEIKSYARCEGSQYTIGSLKQDRMCSDHPANGDSRLLPGMTSDPKQNQQRSQELSVSVTDKLRTLTLTPHEVEDPYEICNQHRNANYQPRRLPRPAQLQVSSEYSSLSEKRKSLTLSLSSLSMNQQTPQSTKLEMETENSSQRHQGNISKTVQNADWGQFTNTTKQSRKAVVSGLCEEAQNILHVKQTHQSKENKTSTRVRKTVDVGRGSCAATHGERIDEVKSMLANSGLNTGEFKPTATIQNQRISTDRQQMSPDGHCAAAVEAVEGLDVDQIPLSPIGLTVSKLLGWGERMLLGTLLGPRVKVGQPALPYRC
ncbi:uncharacterized protein [Paramormyrops kingsleyae]|uniref:uncharacterized protein n=1 Tax=Paramormyrops kingsleyae TaxID=1676925 RepID=UPI003B96DD64